MYLDNKIISLIPARGGSKGIPYKNIKNLAGKPLIYYTINAAKKSRYIDEVLVSTDDEKIAKVAESYGAIVPELRPKEISKDNSSTLDVVLYAIRSFPQFTGADTLILLQPTQPLRTEEDIDKSIESFYQNGKKSLVSISEVDDHPILMRYLCEDNSVKKLFNTRSDIRRQDMEKIYRVNGAIYINGIKDINETTSFNDNQMGFLMEKAHSVDIDDMADMALANYYLELK